MYTISDISAFREQIFANAAFLLEEKSAIHLDAQRRLEIITVSRDDNVYTGALIDLSTGKTLYEGQKDANPAQAIHYLFDLTAQEVGKRFRASEKDADKDEKELAQRKK